MENDEQLVFTRKSSGLSKGLNWWDIFVIVISAPAGSGILYYSVSTASSYPGASVGLSFLIGFLLILPIIFLAALSSNMFPNSGSLYVFISRVINPGVGYLTAVLFFLGYTLSIGVVAFVVVQVIGGIFVTAGMAYKLMTLQNFGEYLQTPLWATIGGATLVLVTWLIVIRGIKVFKHVMRILFFITVISALFTIIYFFLLSQDGIQSLFDRVWGTNSYSNILQLASQKGWSAAPFSMSQTLNLLLVVLFSYAGLELVSYASGEISKDQTKNLRAYMYASFGLALLYILLAFSVTSAFGDFVGAYDFLVKNHAGDLKKIMPAINPSIPFYISSVIPNVWLSIIIAIGLSLWFVNTMVPYFFAPSRLIFALAFDRAIPESMANVSNKTNAPTKASHLTLLFALLGVFFNLLNFTNVLGTILFSAVFVYWLYGLSAIILPYKNPILYERCPIQKKIFGIPLVSVVGIITFGIGWFVIFLSISQMTFDILLTLSIYMTLAIVVYTFKLNKNKKMGIDLNSIYSQLPPE